MARYLFSASYTTDGVRGLLKEGGSSRREAVRQGIEAQGGRLEGFYYTFGKDDVIVIAEVPDNVTAAALSLAISASGSVGIRTTVLLTPEEIDEATKKSVNYRPPGG
jgi:uncharacterized protein with GYD domain